MHQRMVMEHTISQMMFLHHPGRYFLGCEESGSSQDITRWFEVLHQEGRISYI